MIHCRSFILNWRRKLEKSSYKTDTNIYVRINARDFFDACQWKNATSQVPWQSCQVQRSRWGACLPHELTARYTTNGIAFAIDIDCFADPNNPFRKYGRWIFELSVKNGFSFACFVFWPKLLKWTGIRFVDRKVEEFLFNMVKQCA